jgi:NTP pyrophosphatase (non-canonical NTP hydrolase)
MCSRILNIAAYTIEEAYEVAAALSRRDGWCAMSWGVAAAVC